MRLCRYLFASLIASALSSSAVCASTVVQMDLADLSTRAARIFVARCHASEAAAEADRPSTRVEFEVTEVVKGSAASAEVVLLAGGVRDGVRQLVTGMPTFEPGEEVVVFLSAPDARGRSWPIGLGQGKFHVRRDANGDAFVVPGDRAGHASSARPAAPDAPPEPLTVFLDRVRSLAGAQPGAPDAR